MSGVDPAEMFTLNVGRYGVLAQIGEGGYGSVYRARGPDGAEVAIKVLRATNPGAVDRFERESRLLAALTEVDGFVPLIEGGTLRQRLGSGPLPIAETVAIGRSLARAIGRAHARGIVHRDLKPEN